MNENQKKWTNQASGRPNFPFIRKTMSFWTAVLHITAGKAAIRAFRKIEAFSYFGSFRKAVSFRLLKPELRLPAKRYGAFLYIHFVMITPDQQKEIVEIKNHIANNFGQSDWLDFGYSLGCYDIIDGHSRLLRSLNFGDDDYEGNILGVLTDIVERDVKNFDEIKSYLANKFAAPVVSDFISTAHSEIPKKIVTFSPQVFQIPSKAQNDQLVTVMLPFKLQSTFSAVKAACENMSLQCVKADDVWVNPTFIQDIFDLIFTARVVVADFTGKNPNVFYEIGIAHTLGKTVVPITQSMDDVPSDLGHHRALLYHPNAQGYSDLTKELEKRLKTLFPDAIMF